MRHRTDLCQYWHATQRSLPGLSIVSIKAHQGKYSHARVCKPELCHATPSSRACHCGAAAGEAPARAHERAEHLVDSGAFCDLPGYHGVEALHRLQLEIQGRPQPHSSCRVRLCLQARNSLCRLLMRMHIFKEVLLQAVSAQVVCATVLTQEPQRTR